MFGLADVGLGADEPQAASVHVARANSKAPQPVQYDNSDCAPVSPAGERLTVEDQNLTPCI
eukprot:scaffold508259_cov34-Prasinocladus_malaysianus.AAC.1